MLKEEEFILDQPPSPARATINEALAEFAKRTRLYGQVMEEAASILVGDDPGSVARRIARILGED